MEYVALSVSLAASLLGCAAFLSFDLKRVARALERLSDGERPCDERSERWPEERADSDEDLG